MFNEDVRANGYVNKLMLSALEDVIGVQLN